MDTRNKQHRWLLHLLGAAILLLGLAACGSSEGPSEDEPNKPKPEVPVDDGDWQTVPATGGTIEKGDITITFPSGTFSKDTKVAISDVRKGETCGEYEVSKFYQITMPVSTARSLTVKMKCMEKGDDINAVIHAPAIAISEQIEYYDDVILESTFSSGEYTMNLPAFENGEETENVSFSIGIAKIPRIYSDDEGENFTTRSSQINWHYEDATLLYLLKKDNFKALHIAKHINDAIGRLQALGFDVKSSRDIPIKFSNLVIKRKNGEEPVNGYMTQSKLSNKFNTITLNIRFVTQLNQKEGNIEWNEDNLSRTIIHELMHYFQAEYDPRWPNVKAVSSGGDWLQLYESAAVWSEKFNSDNTFSSSFVMESLPNFVRGLTNLNEIYNGNIDYAAHGYGMSLLLEYITRQRTSEKFNNRSVVELYEQWSKNYSILSRSRTTLEYLQSWVESSPHNSNLFKGNEYDNFILSLAKGELVSDINIINFSDSEPMKIPGDGTYSIKNKCFLYGCHPQPIRIQKNEKNSEKGYYNNRELIFLQNNSGVLTYVLHNSGGKWQLAGTTELGRSLIIDGKTLESFRTGDTYVKPFYVISTNQLNQKVLDTDVTIIMQESEKSASVSPTELKFSAEGGTQTVTVTAKGYKKYNHIIDDEYKSWLSGKNNSAGKLDITAQPNTTGKERVGYVKPYVLIDENSTERVYLTPVKVTQAANEKQGDDTQSEFKIVSGAIHMYYAVAWRHDMSFKAGDEFSTITPKGKGANVKYVQSGRDTGANATWKITVTFDVDDLSLVNVQKAKLSNFKFVYERVQGEYNYYRGHADYGREDATMESKVSKSQNANGIWYFEAGDLTYHQESMLHYDAWKKDYYSKPEEHTDRSETDVVTDGSYVNISLEVEKKK